MPTLEEKLASLNITIGVDDKEFIEAMRTGKARVEDFAGRVDTSMKTVELSTRRAFMGFRGLTSVSKDLGDGVRDMGEGIIMAGSHLERAAIAFGASGPLMIGLMGLSAAAAAFGRNWDDLKDIIGDTGPFEAAGRKLESVGDILAAAFVDPANRRFQEDQPGKQNQQIQKDIAEKRKLDAEREKDAEKSRKHAAAVRTKDEQEKAKLFAESLAEYGPDQLRKELITKGTAGRKLTEQQKKKIEQNVDLAIGGALTGKFGRGADFGEQFGNVFQRNVDKSNEAKRKRMDANLERATDKAIKEEDEHRKKSDAALEKRTRDDIENERSLFEMDKKEKELALENQLELAEGHKKHLQHLAKAVNQSQVFQGTRAFATNMLTGGLDQIAKQQLKEAEKLNGKIDGLRQELRKINRMEFQ